jgi:hypothetical protein
MFMIFYWTKLNLSNTKCNGLSVIFKYNVNFNFLPPSTFIYFFNIFEEMVLMKVVYNLKICQHACHVPM